MKKTLLTAAALTTLGLSVLSGCGVDKNEWVEATVKDKERTCFTSTDCRFIVYTDEENFEITDQFVGRKNSSDVYGQIQRDRRYRFYVIGYRNPNQTKFRNIMEVQEVKIPSGTTVTIAK